MSLSTDLVIEARTYLGVKWLHQGRSREGIDCVGLPIVCAQKILGTKFKHPDYGRVSEDESMMNMCVLHLNPIDMSDMSPADVIVLGYGKQRHMALLGNYPGGLLSIIHSYLPNRKVVECRLNAAWRRRIIAAFRFREIS